MLEGIRMAHHAWQSVSKATVVNCWSQTGILEGPSTGDPLDDENCSLAELLSLIQKLRSEPVDDDAVLEYLDVDGHDETCAIITNEDVVDIVGCNDDSRESDDGTEEPRVVTPQKARNALRTALVFFGQKNNVPQVNAITKGLGELGAYSNLAQMSMDSFICITK